MSALSLCLSSAAVSLAVYPVSFDIRGDFAPVALLSSSPLMMIGRKSLPADNVKELIAWLKDNPGKATSGTVGVGSPSQVGAIYFQKLTGTQIRLVPLSRRRRRSSICSPARSICAWVPKPRKRYRL